MPAMGFATFGSWGFIMINGGERRLVGEFYHLGKFSLASQLHPPILSRSVTAIDLQGVDRQMTCGIFQFRVQRCSLGSFLPLLLPAV